MRGTLYLQAYYRFCGCILLADWKHANRPSGTSAGLTERTSWHNSGRAELGKQTRPSVVLSRCVEAERPSCRAAINVADIECCPLRKDCQEPPYADSHVRWCGSPEGQPSRRPD